MIERRSIELMSAEEARGYHDRNMHAHHTSHDKMDILLRQMDTLIHLTHHSASSNALTAKSMWINRVLSKSIKVTAIVGILAVSSYVVTQHGDRIMSGVSVAGLQGMLDKSVAYSTAAFKREIAPTVDAFVDAAFLEVYTPDELPANRPGAKSDEITDMTATHESKGDWGIRGWDSGGGYSYGLFQIASKTGTLGKFMAWLGKRDPESQAALNAVGGTKAGVNGRKAFHAAWKELSKGERFRRSQYQFVWDTHYRPVIDNMNAIGLHPETRNKAVQAVIFSMAVQQGPGTHIPNRIVKKHGADISDEMLIKEMLRLRHGTTGHLTAGEKKGVSNRYREEERKALAMLNR